MPLIMPEKYSREAPFRRRNPGISLIVAVK